MNKTHNENEEQKVALEETQTTSTDDADCITNEETMCDEIAETAETEDSDGDEKPINLFGVNPKKLSPREKKKYYRQRKKFIAEFNKEQEQRYNGYVFIEDEPEEIDQSMIDEAKTIFEEMRDKYTRQKKEVAKSVDDSIKFAELALDLFKNHMQWKGELWMTHVKLVEFFEEYLQTAKADRTKASILSLGYVEVFSLLSIMDVNNMTGRYEDAKFLKDHEDEIFSILTISMSLREYFYSANAFLKATEEVWRLRLSGFYAVKKVSEDTLRFDLDAVLENVEEQKKRAIEHLEHMAKESGVNTQE